jgi:hypothetical protein
MTKTLPLGAEPALVFEDRWTSGRWRVEWFDDDGRCELEIFTGPIARRQALRYALRRYGHFTELQLERSMGMTLPWRELTLSVAFVCGAVAAPAALIVPQVINPPRPALHDAAYARDLLREARSGREDKTAIAGSSAVRCVDQGQPGSGD